MTDKYLHDKFFSCVFCVTRGKSQQQFLLKFSNVLMCKANFSENMIIKISRGASSNWRR